MADMMQKGVLDCNILGHRFRKMTKDEITHYGVDAAEDAWIYENKTTTLIAFIPADGGFSLWELDDFDQQRNWSHEPEIGFHNIDNKKDE